MATVNHASIVNITMTNPLSYQPQSFNTIWYLTRALKKAGWKYKGGGDGGSVKDTTQLASNDPWGGFSVTTRSNVGDVVVADIASPSRGRAQVSGLSGIVAADKGRFLRIYGAGASGGINNEYHQIEEVINSTTVKIDARTIAVVAESGLSWEIHDPRLGTFPTLTGAAWWSAQGPSILKIPITATPAVGGSGLTFLRGENIVQATTGFEGEILGYIFDTDTSTGYLSVCPRVRGTGSGRYGLDTGYQFTGSVTGSTVTQNGVAVEYVRQIIFWKTVSSEVTGAAVMAVLDPVANSADLIQSRLAGATAVQPPWNGSAGGAFPSRAGVMLGQTWAGTTTPTSPSQWVANVSDSNRRNTWNRAHCLAADAIEEQNWSADGSWWWLAPCWNSADSTQTGMMGWGYQRLDDVEDGELDPYIAMAGGLQTLYTNSATSIGTSRASSNGITTISGSDFCTADSLWDSNTKTVLRGWRGFGTTVESRQDYTIANLWVYSSTNTYIHQTSVTDAERMVTVPGNPKTRDPIWVVSTQLTKRQKKGTFRWWYTMGGTTMGQLYDDKLFIQATVTLPAGIVGPWDGATLVILN